MGFGKTKPILRIFDEEKAKEFYINFLGFRIDWNIAWKRAYRSICKSQRMTASFIYQNIMAIVVRAPR